VTFYLCPEGVSTSTPTSCNTEKCWSSASSGPRTAGIIWATTCLASTPALARRTRLARTVHHRPRTTPSGLIHSTTPQNQALPRNNSGKAGQTSGCRLIQTLSSARRPRHADHPQSRRWIRAQVLATASTAALGPYRVCVTLDVGTDPDGIHCRAGSYRRFTRQSCGRGTHLNSQDGSLRVLGVGFHERRPVGHGVLRR
jgi:hypothetical protein